jgi:probable phosphoglycerate mutase
LDEPSLTELGYAQSRCTADALAGERFDALYVSPLRRARETAQPIAEKLGLEPQVLSWLRELELPSLEGNTPEQVQAFFRDGRLRDPDSWWDGYEGGESFRHFYERVAGGIDALLTDSHAMNLHEDTGHRLWQVPDWDARILVVAHEGTIAIMTSHLLGIEPNPWTPLRFAVAWTGIARLHTAQLGSGAVWSLAAFNSTDHLSSLAAERDGRAARSVT